jgi:preprotein translocase subunit SecE
VEVKRMAEATSKAESVKTTQKTQKKSWAKGLKTEWDKIVWTDKKTLGKQTAAVVVISAIVCGLITLADSVGLQLIELVIK